MTRKQTWLGPAKIQGKIAWKNAQNQRIGLGLSPITDALL